MQRIQIEIGLARCKERGMYKDSQFTEDADGDHLVINLYDLVEQVVRMTPEEDIGTFIEALGITRKVREFMVDRLSKDYSRPSYNSDVHDDRVKFLKAIKDEELAFYACAIASQITEEMRWQNACRDLGDYCRRHHCFDHCREVESPPQWPDHISMDVRQKIMDEVREMLAGVLPSPVEEHEL